MGTEFQSVDVPLTNRELTITINKAMKKAGRYSQWKFSRVGTFIAISAKDDVKVSDAHYCMLWFKTNFPSLIGDNMAPVFGSNCVDNNTVINFAAG